MMYSRLLVVLVLLLTVLTNGCIFNSDDSNYFPPTAKLNEGFYNFDEVSGSTANNSLSDNLHGTIVGAERVQGKIGNAINFDLDASSRVVLKVCCSGLEIEFPQDIISIEGWISLNTLDLTSTYPIFGNSYFSMDSFKVYIEGGKISFSLNSIGAGGGETLILSSNTVLETQVWFHFVINYDGSQATIYINGVEDNARSIVHPVLPVINDLYIGGDGTTSFPGIIDELRFSNSLKSANEISSYYNQNM